tara:strand:+ start:268 stop:2130 length:1863 start_codon:yes stop_codon:yes gene_type:complete
MGAYENPKSYTVDYTAGVKAFTDTFNKGLQAGIQKGEEMIADRKEYEDSIYEQGEAMEKELQAAVDNGTQTKEEINQALEQFYSEALKVEQPTRKGLGGLFSMPKENRMDKKGLRDAQNSFQSAVTPINTVMDYVYTSGLDINEDEDRGAEKYEEKKAIYNAVRMGISKPSFTYNKELGKFESYMIVNGKKYSPELLQTIFTSSGKEQRQIIDGKKDDYLKSAKNRSIANLKNLVTADKADNKETSYQIAMDEVKRTVYNSMGLDKENMTRNELSLANDIYNNHVDISEEKKLEIMRNSLSKFNLPNDQLERIIDLPMNIGSKKIQNLLGTDEKTSQEIFKQSQRGKSEIVAQYTINQIENEGVLDQFYKAPQDSTKTRGGSGGSGGGDQSNIYAQQMMNKTYNISSEIQGIIADPTSFSSNRETLSAMDYNLLGINEISDGGVVRSVESSSISPEGILTLSFQPKSKIVTGIDKNSKEYKELISSPEYATKTDDEKNKALMNLPSVVMEQAPQKSLKFDMFNPYDLEKFYKRLQGKESELNESTKSQPYKTYFDQQFYFKYIQNPSSLADDRMAKFRPYVINKYKENQGLSREQAIQSLTKNYPRLASMDWFKREALKL